MNGVFYIVGAGPGDPELLTLKAARILGRCPVWFAPRASREGDSTALAIVGQVVETAGREILTHHFPMKKIPRGQAPDPEVAAAWDAAAKAVTERLRAGKDVAFPTLGDPAVYSTGFYVAEALLARDPATRIEIVPGVSSIGASAAVVGEPLCQGDDRLVVVPATYENGLLRETLAQFDAVVLMKVHRVLPRVVGLLDEMGLTGQAVLVERTGQVGQRIVRDLRRAAGEPCHYFSTIIVRKNGRPGRQVA